MKEIIDTYLRYLRIERNASPHTLEAYNNDLNQLNSFIDATYSDIEDINNLNRQHLRGWLASLNKKEVKRSTLQRKIASIRSFFKFAFKRGYVNRNIAVHIISPKSEKRLPSTISHNEINQTLNQAIPNDEQDSTHAWNLQTAAIMELLYSTGIRLGELVNLDVEDVDLSASQIKVLGKGSKQRIVPFGQAAHEAITAFNKFRHQLSSNKITSEVVTPMFMSVKGKRIYPRAVQRMVKQQLTTHTEAVQKSPHTLRHCFATHLMDNGADIRVIKELLGHSSLNSTQIYTSTSSQKLKETYKHAHPRAEN